MAASRHPPRRPPDAGGEGGRTPKPDPLRPSSLLLGMLIMAGIGLVFVTALTLVSAAD